MLKWTWSPPQNSQLVSAPSCGTATPFSSGAEEYDILYTPVNCKVVNFLCSWQKWSIGLTPYKCLTFSLLPLLSCLPAPEMPQTTTSIKSHTLFCTQLHRTARMFALYFSIKVWPCTVLTRYYFLSQAFFCCCCLKNYCYFISHYIWGEIENVMEYSSS